ncbi:MAG: hypothetical protein KA988_06600, partial [Longilinea sp.]|nr:hypothetical protein [Longilinea sp.]
LLLLFSNTDVEMVKVSPTWKPQSLNAQRRLQRVLERHPLTAAYGWHKESGYLYRLGRARISFLSAAPESNIVGATANLLLEVDEAQDVQIAKFDKEVAPMAASTNATRVFWGTAWNDQTLLARELRAAQAAEQRDGRRRVFRITAEHVAAECPPYADFVAAQVARFGRAHPLIRTQFFSEEISSQTGLLNEARLQLMQGKHASHAQPQAGALYAFTLDVGGEDAGLANGSGELQNPRRDATALTIFALDQSRLSDPLFAAPIYQVMQRFEWVGVPHPQLYAALLSLAQTWQPRFIVVDATGVGAGLAAFLGRALPGRVLPFLFNPATKSSLGWRFLAIIETGRFQEADPQSCSPAQRALRERFLQQGCACTLQTDGLQHSLRWSVPDSAQDPATGLPLHDDLLLSAALCAVLEDQPWPRPARPTQIVRAADPLTAIDHGGF